MSEKLNWEVIEQQFNSLLDVGSLVDAENGVVAMVYIGSVMSLAPSGKYWTFWTSNQNQDDVEKDTKYWEEFDAECKKHNAYRESGEGDPTDVFVCRHYTWEQVAEYLNKNGGDEKTIFQNLETSAIGYGSEVHRVPGEWFSNYCGDIRFTYVNMGDSYIPTLFYDHKEEAFFGGDIEVMLGKLEN